MMKRIIFTSMLLLLWAQEANSFCGFYVAKADAKLFNKSSQVILVRDGERLTITMSNDYQGEVKDFAMVIPVPVVLKKENIKVLKRVENQPSLFEKLDAYSAPRLVEYYDRNPCYQYKEEKATAANATIADSTSVAPKDKYHVKIEAKFTVGEYDILVLSAQESGGLERWLTDNGYKIPAQAKEVLEPYIKSGMKFFVAKVNLGLQAKKESQLLSPIQMSFNSPKFMLPIRLGMANATDFQDLIIYALTKNGRVECSNYRTVEMPTATEIPTFIKQDFSNFYKSTFETAYQKENKKAIFLEYAWNLNSENFFACDPCVAEPPKFAEMKEAGATWLSAPSQDNYSGADYAGKLFFTRLHVRYDRANFAQDLTFQETPNAENYQARYVLRYPISKAEAMECSEGKTYWKEVQTRRAKELENLVTLTGWKLADYPHAADYVEDKGSLEKAQTLGDAGNEEENKGISPVLVGVIALAVAVLTWIVASGQKPRN
ncbi:MAG: DUF2330 domain-containing protein [Bacteroidia bacterium]